ncbi:GntR family transcriptional regulator [Christensenella timonensis]|uniref:GntR family transcriptional regulator n=1 Tax=Christensenella timonensis TaxID=1816678 RepID=UPI000835AD1C|nr:GntR family transcriptional regulator [Christensenella timonensis]
MSPIFDSEIQFESKLPLHYQIMMIIKRNIASKNILPGDKLPTEEEFCNVFGVSRSTVRAAIGELEEEGMVTRVRGKGTFISKTKLKRKMEQVYSFSHQMEASSLVPSSRLLEFKTIAASDGLIDLFGLEENDPVYEIVRLRMANGEPLLLETTFLPVKVHPTLRAEVLESGSLYDSLRDEAKISPYIAEETYESIVFEESICKMLECQYPTCGFYVERITRQESGDAYELTQSFMRGDRSKISITLQQDIYTFNRSID